MSLNATIAAVTDRIRKRSEPRRTAYLEKMRRAAEDGPRRGHRCEAEPAGHWPPPSPPPPH